MKKINAWLNKFFGIGAGDDVETNVVSGDWISDREFDDYQTYLDGKFKAIIDHNKKTVTFKMI